ncbi:hypothetical protein M441DRAFT_267947 [Trichoderma asperellum CBS 433.97]|uniref:Uncharacterized protein n=1 Tax=Trichoderma asperellum (strain ATCC 204424 / CBS 433.97 / NBRC 101777) TaxID=1042311 RepID=A0A2T3YVY4_TRIA4|nr:hypothetical protein M441DRAFT_267947 [Trichoderma asperellum CBS 433.97]PTB36696.1 hypothetical protein M441DRAFT_267947 [Trichoderma asperellum CBS 433.97]
MLLRASFQVSTMKMRTLFFRHLERRGSLNIGELREYVAPFLMPHSTMFFFLSFSLFLVSVQSFVRKGVESNGVGDSGFQFSIGCMGVGTQKGLIFGANPIE